MLKGVPKIISPKLLRILAEMGHTSELVIGDGNCSIPEWVKANDAVLVRCDGVGAAELLDAILTLIPLDFTDDPVRIMDMPDGFQAPIWDKYREIVAKHDPRGAKLVTPVPQMEFYEQAKKCGVVIATTESEVCANVIIKKGVIYPGEN